MEVIALQRYRVPEIGGSATAVGVEDHAQCSECVTFGVVDDVHADAFGVDEAGLAELAEVNIDTCPNRLCRSVSRLWVGLPVGFIGLGELCGAVAAVNSFRYERHYMSKIRS